ncbi:hypothetical protein BDBG_09501 [Blastomyces gilchristii SLH14081]|uniref:Uncharacterized protein n=2 Tax=Blastomyces TaxID=229219 RepID=A0A179V2E1_BLAGS|nr:uncharacterized protein BDBG_09501 [Blastomyces gilchristii SLH14081]EGE85352.1 hypothetical protein BDDG_08297 [Blastomyces dermatitidis ATCC 18188]OAT14485.1 hypothetical protein BDBG_09501 [Blastomyces gilchristii SLH14081]
MSPSEVLIIYWAFFPPGSFYSVSSNLTSQVLPVSYIVTSPNPVPRLPRPAAIDKAKKARDTLGSIYSFYAANRDSLERVPSFMSDSSRDLPIIFQTDPVPTAEETEQLKKNLSDLIKTQEIFNQIPDQQRQLMVEAANASTIKRAENRAAKN